MSTEIPLMVNKTTSMERLISYPFYECAEGNYLTRKPSITYVKSFLNKFFSELVNDNFKCPLSDSKRNEKVEEEFVTPQQISLPSKTFVSMNTENTKELNDENEIPNKIESESELASSKSYVSQSSESEIIISHYAGKLCAVLFYAEIRNLVKKQIRKTLKENLGQRLKNKNDISVDIKRHKDIQKDEEILISGDLVAVKEDMDTNVNHDNILEKTRLEIHHITNNNKESQDFKRKKTIGKEKDNKEIKNTNNILKIQRLEMYKGNVLVPSTITIFKRPFLRKLFLKKKLKALDSRNVISEKNKSINRNKILKKRISMKNEGAQYHPYSKSIDNKAWVVETDCQGNRIGRVDEVSVEL